MIRLVQRRLIIPRGDTGEFEVPVLKFAEGQNVAVFSIIDLKTRSIIYRKEIQVEGDSFKIEFTHNDTVNLPVGKYVWDIKFYKNPVYADEELINGEEVDSYYSGFSLPECEIRPTGDKLAMSDAAPATTLAPDQLDIITAAINEIHSSLSSAEDYADAAEAAWHLLENCSAEAVSVESDEPASARYEDGTFYFEIPKGEVPDIPTNLSAFNNDVGYLTEHQDISGKQDKLTFDSQPKQYSENPVTSAGIYESIRTVKNDVSSLQTNVASVQMDISMKADKIDMNMLQSQVNDCADDIIDLKVGKQNKLTFDNTPTANSTNPVTSGGIYNAISNINVMKIHICTNSEYNSETGVPTVQNADEQTFYLVPGGEGSNLYIEWIYINNSWEQFGSATIDLSDYALKSELPTKVSDLSNDAGYLTQHQDISGKQNILTFDSQPKRFSNNPVTSDGIYESINSVKSDVTSLQGDMTTAQMDINMKADKTDVSILQSQVDSCADDIVDLKANKITDIQIDGTSIVSNNIANIPPATASNFGVVKVNSNGSSGLGISSIGNIYAYPATVENIKEGTHQNRAIMPFRQHIATFYGLAKSAGDTTQAQSENDIGVYTDTAKTKIQNMLNIPSANVIASLETNGTATKNYSVNELFVMDGKLYKTTSAIATNGAIVTEGSGQNCEEVSIDSEFARSSDIPNVPVQDVQVNGTSILNNGVANVPIASSGAPGVVMVDQSYGIIIHPTLGYLAVNQATANDIKSGTVGQKPIVPYTQHASAFYGLAKAAGDSTQSSSSNAVGTYTESAKSAINQMLNAPVTVSGTTPAITAKAGIQYVCGEVFTLTIVVPESGCIDVIFESGSTPTVFTVTPPAGKTMQWPDWFDPNALETNATYEINVLNGTLGAVGIWM